jgi:signal peptidase II
MMASSKLTVALVAVFSFAADQSMKSWARNHLTPGTIKPFIPGILQFNLTTNTGGAFGIGRDLSWLMTTLAVLLTLAIISWIAKRQRSQYPPFAMESVGLALVLGGALGNLCDRFTVGRVTDFIEFAFFSFPVFNVADVAIDFGIVLIACDYYAKRAAVDALLSRLDADEGQTEGRSAPEKQ